MYHPRSSIILGVVRLSSRQLYSDSSGRRFIPELNSKSLKYVVGRYSSPGDWSRSRDFERDSVTSSAAKLPLRAHHPFQRIPAQSQGWNIKLHSTSEWLCNAPFNKSPTFMRRK